MMTFDKAAFRSLAVRADEKFISKLERCLVLAPHPDDESLGCGGLIRTLLQKGCDVRVILTTDGSQSHPHSVEYPATRLSALRKAEMTTALECLGLSARNISFYDSKDSAMPASGENGFNQLSQLLNQDLLSFLPQLILVPYEFDPHRDHRATFQLLLAALKRVPAYKPVIWEYPIWLYENAIESDWPQLEQGELKYLDISEHLKHKRAAIDAHQSQTTRLIHDDPKGFILTEHMISNFLNGNEYFMEHKKSNPTDTLSKDYFESLYGENPDPWSFETSDYEKSKYEATIAAIPGLAYAQALEIGCSIGVLTQMLCEVCDRLISMDISEKALQNAQTRMEGNPKVHFIQGGIPADYPKQNFNLIVMSEVGYYLSKEDLLITRSLILETLELNGILVLVHWTHFVADYPLTGDEVHDCFANVGLLHLKGNRTDDYRLDVYQKQS